MEANENGSTTFQNLRDIEKAVPRGKFIMIHTYVRKQTNKQKSQINHLTLHLKKLEKEEQKTQS